VLDAYALEDFTGGRLPAEDAETVAVLGRALAEVQRWCGWHVTPARDDVVTMDGHGGTLLRLPTLSLAAITAVTEDGAEVDPAGLQWSRFGMVRKNSGGVWTGRLGGLTIAMTHGYADALDFEAAVLSVADRRASQAATSGGAPVSVGPFRFAGDPSTAFAPHELSVMEHYRLERSA